MMDELTPEEEAMIDASAPGVDVPIAKELLQVERERLARDHYEERLPENYCKECQRLGAIIAELKLLG